MRLQDRVAIFSDAREVGRRLAARVADAIRRRPSIVLGLPTGRTPLLFYEELTALARSGAVDFSRVTTFNLDEFLGLPPSHASSYRTFMERHLFEHVNVDRARINFLDGAAADAAAEAERYEHAIAAAGGIDLVILGIGTNGHIGFNEPSSGLEARTHRVVLKPETRRSNAPLFGGNADAVPPEALTMGMGTILAAREAILLATGERKASCVEQLVTGPITTQLPASFLQLHRNVEIMLDEAAGQKVRSKK